MNNPQLRQNTNRKLDIKLREQQISNEGIDIFLNNAAVKNL